MVEQVVLISTPFSESVFSNNKHLVSEVHLFKNLRLFGRLGYY